MRLLALALLLALVPASDLVGPVLSAFAMSGRGRPDEPALLTGPLSRTGPADRRSSKSVGWLDQPLHAQGRGVAASPQTPRARAPIDLTGQWVAIISEDWRWRMITPPKGDIVSIPLTLQGQQAAEAWDPAKDEAGGEQCKAYGAPGLMRGPIRMRISWQGDTTLKLETDYGMQARLFRFGDAATQTGPRSWQGQTTAEWIVRGGGRGGAPRFGSLKSVTRNLRPGYLRKNGVPYSEKAVFTEYWDVHALPNGDKYLVNTNVVEDPVYLQAPFQTAIHYKQERDTSKWDPTPCDARF